MRNFFHFILIFSLALYFSLTGNLVINADEISSDIVYHKIKASGRYFDAVEYLNSSSLIEKNEHKLELNIMRLQELMVYPELFPAINNAISRIYENKLIFENYHLHNRINIIRNRLALSEGDIRQSEKIIQSSGFLKFRITGPFKSVTEEDFQSYNPAWEQYYPDAEYNGKVYKTGWFNAVSDREGKVNADNFLDDTSDSLCILFTEFNVPDDDVYIISLGKTGFTDIKIDEKLIFSNKNRHSFSFDQYFIKIKLGAGSHKLFARISNSRAGLKFAARVTDKKGKPVFQNMNPQKYNPEKTSLISAAYNNVVEYYSSKPEMKSTDNFIAGYIQHVSGLSSENNSEMLKYMTKIQKGDPCYSYSKYYTAMTEHSADSADEYLSEAYRADNSSIETIAEIAEMKIKAGSFYEAYPLINRINELDDSSHYIPLLLSYFNYEKGWNYEIDKQKKLINKNDIHSSVYFFAVKNFINDKLYADAEKLLNEIYQSDKYDLRIIEHLISCRELSGNLQGAMNLLWDAAVIFPDRVSIRIWMAKIAERLESPANALKHLSSAKRISPYNKDMLFSTGLIYESINKPELAKDFLTLSSFYDPDNYGLKKYLERFNDQSAADIFKLYEHPESIDNLINISDKFIDESVIVLLQECLISVNSDGSFEKRIRNIIRINDAETASDYNNQYIVIDPSTETIEKIKCIHEQDKTRNEITQKYRKSLSEPDSRLYYDLEAVIIPVNPSKGSIIDFSYTIKNRGGKLYKNYYGEKIILGSRYRTIKTNTVMIYPDSRKINFHVRHIDMKNVITKKNQNGNIIHITRENLHPVKEEPAMPNLLSVLPAVFFSSFNSWDDLSSYYINLLRDKIKVSQQMKNDMNELIKNGDTDEIKIQKIYSFITSKIRYVGFEFGLSGIQPRAADLTYKTAIGDCKDVSILLAALLRETGVDSKIALVRTRDKGDADLNLPYLGEFNHAICYVRTLSGKEFFLDGTSRSSAYNELPSDDRNIQALVIDERNQVSNKAKTWFFKNTDSDLYVKEFEKVKTEVILKPDGSAVINRYLLKQGTLAAAARDNLKNSSLQKHSLNEYWNRLYSGSVVQNIKTINHEKELPAEYSYTVKIPSFAVKNDNLLIYNAFINKSNYYKDFAASKNRNYDLRMSGRNETQVLNEFVIPDGYSVILPSNEVFINSKYKAEYKYTLNKNRITVSSIINFNEYLIPVNEYPVFRNFCAFIQKKESERIILTKK